MPPREGWQWQPDEGNGAFSAGTRLRPWKHPEGPAETADHETAITDSPTRIGHAKWNLEADISWKTATRNG